MPLSFPTITTVEATNVKIKEGKETVVTIIQGLSVPVIGTVISLVFNMIATPVKGSTGTIIRFRQGTTTGGTLLAGSAELTAVGGSGDTLPLQFGYRWAPGEIANVSVCATVEQPSGESGKEGELWWGQFIALMGSH